MNRTVDSRRDVMTGEVWNRFCDELKAVGQTIISAQGADSEIDRAEGWRYLSRLTRLSLEMMLECSDPDFPVFYQASNATIKVGGDNPDNHYLNATIAGDRVYRLRGNRGTVPFLSFATKANRYAVDGTMASTGEIDAKNLLLDDSGNFEITVSRSPVEGNWLPMDADSSMLLIRNSFLDRKSEVAATVTIERIGGVATPNALSADKLVNGLDAAAAFVRGTSRLFANWTNQFRANTNRFTIVDQEMFTRAGGERAIHYLHGYWELPPGKALVVTIEPPSCEVWNFHIDNYWMESLDYRYLPICVNKHTAVPDSDGRVTVVIAGENRGFTNWLNPAGHERGTMLLRWVRAETHPVPDVALMDLEDAPVVASVAG